jgi:hypothetical protein
MFGQVLGQPDQVGPQAFGADVIRTLGNDAKGKIQPVAVGPPPLPVAGAPGQVLAHQPGQALAVEVGHLLHLVEHLAPLPTAGLTVAGLKEAEVFRRSAMVISSSVGIAPSVTFSFERTIYPR